MLGNLGLGSPNSNCNDMAVPVVENKFANVGLRHLETLRRCKEGLGHSNSNYQFPFHHFIERCKRRYRNSRILLRPHPLSLRYAGTD